MVFWRCDRGRLLLAKDRKLRLRLLVAPDGREGVKRGHSRSLDSVGRGSGIGLSCGRCRSAVQSVLPRANKALREVLHESESRPGGELFGGLIKGGAESFEHGDLRFVYLGRLLGEAIGGCGNRHWQLVV